MITKTASVALLALGGALGSTASLLHQIVAHQLRKEMRNEVNKKVLLAAGTGVLGGSLGGAALAKANNKLKTKED